ncbi:hypothetical protein [Streptococcus dentiloxodontae]
MAFGFKKKNKVEQNQRIGVYTDMPNMMQSNQAVPNQTVQSAYDPSVINDVQEYPEESFDNYLFTGDGAEDVAISVQQQSSYNPSNIFSQPSEENNTNRFDPTQSYQKTSDDHLIADETDNVYASMESTEQSLRFDYTKQTVPVNQTDSAQLNSVPHLSESSQRTLNPTGANETFVPQGGSAEQVQQEAQPQSSLFPPQQAVSAQQENTGVKIPRKKRFGKRKKKQERVLPASTPEPKNVESTIQVSNRIAKLEQEKKIVEKGDIDSISTLEIINIKRLVPVKDFPLQTKDDNYIQLLEIEGQELSSMTYDERQLVIGSFYQWLNSFTYDWQFETTTLPTDTRSQSMNFRQLLQKLQEELFEAERQGSSERKITQLKEREKLIRNSLFLEDIVADSLYNSEFIMWVYADTIEELDLIVRRAPLGIIKPKVISSEKKRQLIKQYYNQNEKV